MIGAIAAAALVEALGGENLHHRQGRRVGAAVRDPNGADTAARLVGEDIVKGLVLARGDAVRRAAFVENVAAEPREIGGSPRTHHTLRDHRLKSAEL